MQNSYRGTSATRGADLSNWDRKESNANLNANSANYLLKQNAYSSGNSQANGGQSRNMV